MMKQDCRSLSDVWGVLGLLALLSLVDGCRGGGDDRQSAPGEARLDTHGERGAVLEVLRQQEEAWNRGDLEGFLRGYSDSPETTFFSGATVERGFSEVRERYRARYGSPGKETGKEMGRLAFTDLDAEVLSPHKAVARGRFHLTLRDGERGGLFTLLLSKTPSGWRIVHDHTSS